MNSREISSDWKPRAAVVKKLLAMQVDLREKRSSIQEFNEGCASTAGDLTGFLPTFPYAAVAGFEECQAVASGLKGEAWEERLAKAQANLSLILKYQFYMSYRHRNLWPHHGHPSKELTLVWLAKSVASQFVLGQLEQAVEMGRIAYAALDRTSRFAAARPGYNPSRSYVLDDGEDWQGKGIYYNRRAQAFILRLFGDWNGLSREWLPYAYDVPAYEWLLANWRTPDPRALVPALMEVANRHTYESRDDTRKEYHDFHEVMLYRFPIEILMLYRLRELEGLDNPVLDHPLCAPPFDTLPQPIAVYEDELIRGSLARVRIDSPDFDAVIADAIAYPLRDPHAR